MLNIKLTTPRKETAPPEDWQYTRLIRYLLDVQEKRKRQKKNNIYLQMSGGSKTIILRLKYGSLSAQDEITRDPNLSPHRSGNKP